ASDDEPLCHSILMRLGALWEDRLHERDEALQFYRRARAYAPRDKDTLLSLARLLDETDTPQELFAVLEALADQAEEAKALLVIMPRMAALAAGPLAKRREAIELWKRVLELSPQHSEAMNALDALYDAEGRWEELAQHLAAQIRLARDEREMMR